MHDTDLLMTIDYAKAECSKNRRCVAVEYDDDTGLFRACLDATYASTGAEKYLNITYKLFRKIKGYGKCTNSLLFSFFELNIWVLNYNPLICLFLNVLSLPIRVYRP